MLVRQGQPRQGAKKPTRRHVPRALVRHRHDGPGQRPQDSQGRSLGASHARNTRTQAHTHMERSFHPARLIFQFPGLEEWTISVLPTPTRSQKYICTHTHTHSHTQPRARVRPHTQHHIAFLPPSPPDLPVSRIGRMDDSRSSNAHSLTKVHTHAHTHTYTITRARAPTPPTPQSVPSTRLIFRFPGLENGFRPFFQTRKPEDQAGWV